MILVMNPSIKRLQFIGFILYVIVERITSLSASTCLIHDKCLEELRKFTQADEFHVYTSLQEAENACSEAKDNFLCVQSATECRDPSQRAKLSPLIKGSYRLLKEFCGFRSKRRPCCALRTAYLEHSSCYEEVSERLNDCNDKFKRSLDVILTMQGEHEQNKQRFCSVKWFGNCVRTATQSYCGKVAAQVIKTYVMKASKPEKSFVQENKECHETLYGYEKDRGHFCEKKNFQKCHVHLLFLHEYLVEDRLTDDEKFLSVCTGVHDSLECLNQAYGRCLFSRQSLKFGRLRENELENKACLVKENVLQKYRGKVHCLTEHIQHLSQCQPEYNIPAENSVYSIPVSQHYQYFCESLKKLEMCWIEKAASFCGDIGKIVISSIIQMAATNLHQRCNM